MRTTHGLSGFLLVCDSQKSQNGPVLITDT